eukprot:sb/3466795/
MPPQKRSKAYYVQSAKRPKSHGVGKSLEALKQSTPGVIVTANFLKGGCKREVLQLLKEFSGVGGYHSNKKSTSDDVTEEIAAEIAELKKERIIFDKIDLSNNMMFVAVRDQEINPTTLVHQILTSLKDKKQRRTRFTQKIQPVAHTCYASVEDITKVALTMLEGVFYNDTPKTFSIVYKARNNNSLNRDDVIKAVATVATDNDKWKESVKVNLDNPEWAITVDVFQSVAFLGLLPDYVLLAKYNVDNLTSEWMKKDEEKAKEEVGEKEGEKEGENVVAPVEDGEENVKSATEEKKDTPAKEGVLEKNVDGTDASSNPVLSES